MVVGCGCFEGRYPEVSTHRREKLLHPKLQHYMYPHFGTAVSLLEKNCRKLDWYCQWLLERFTVDRKELAVV